MTVTFEISCNPQLLDQYYQLRDKYFKRDLGVSEFNGQEDETDRNSHILLAHTRGTCIAGARIVSSAPMEQQLKEFRLSDSECCMWERFVMHPKARNLDLGRDFCSALIEVSRNMGYSHALVLSTLRISRLYRLCHSGLGINFKIRRPAPECAKGAFANVEHYLSVAQFESAKLRNVLAVNSVPAYSEPLQAVV